MIQLEEFVRKNKYIILAVIIIVIGLAYYKYKENLKVLSGDENKLSNYCRESCGYCKQNCPFKRYNDVCECSYCECSYCDDNNCPYNKE